MSSLVMDSDLRQALEDVAKASPSNGVFKGLGAVGVRGTFVLPDQPISLARAGLSSAERHILQVHRGELAWLLEEAFRISHLEAIGPDPDIEPQVDLGTMADLVPKAERIQERIPAEAMRYRAGHFLGCILSGRPIASWDDRASMLVAAMRLRDSGFARYGYAHGELKRGRTRAARQAAECLLDEGDPMMAAYAHSLYRDALYEEGRTARSVQHGLMAVELAMQTERIWLARTEAAHLLDVSATSGVHLEQRRIERAGLSMSSVIEREEDRLAKLKARGRISGSEHDLVMGKLRKVVS